MKLFKSYLLILFGTFFLTTINAQVLHDNSCPSISTDFTLDWGSVSYTAGSLSQTISNVDGSGYDATFTVTGATGTLTTENGVSTPGITNSLSGGADALHFSSTGLDADEDIILDISFSPAVAGNIAFDVYNIIDAGTPGSKITVYALTADGNYIIPSFADNGNPSWNLDGPGVIDGDASSTAGTNDQAGIQFSSFNQVTNVFVEFSRCIDCGNSANTEFAIGDIDFCLVPDTDKDGVSDPVDDDTDGDGISDEIEKCPSNTTYTFNWSDYSWQGSPTQTSNSYRMPDGTDVSFAAISNGANLQSIDINSDRVSGFGANEEVWEILSDQLNNNQSVDISMSFSQAINNVSFTITDVDEAAGDFTDSVIVVGYFSSFVVFPTLTASGSDVAVTNNTAVGQGTVTDIFGNTANVLVEFDTPIDSITIFYSNGETAPASPGDQAIGFYDISYIGDCGSVDSDGDGVPDYLDIDADNDGIVDYIEMQGSTGSPVQPSGVDTDGDGIDNNFEVVITPVDTDGDGIPDFKDQDSDDDGDLDLLEAWDSNNDGLADTSPSGVDSDGDGLDDNFDDIDLQTPGNELTNMTNDGQTSDDFFNLDGGTVERDWREDTDIDNDGIQDYEDIDDDNDGILDINEAAFGNNPNGDADGDGIPNWADTDDGGTGGDGSPTDYTDSNADGIPDVFDVDGDGIPNHHDLDADNDGIPDIIEAGGTDSNNDGIADNLTDSDNDGLVDLYDTGGTLLGKPDIDGDGLSNHLDLDADNDGIQDIIEAGGTDANNDGIVDGVFSDPNENGWFDIYDTGDGGTAINYISTDSDGIYDFLDLDSDNDGITDIIEAGGIDADGDGYSDVTTDSDDDGWADTFDSDNGGSVLDDLDKDNDGLKDRYDLDSDNDGIKDIIEGGGVDSDGDGIQDDLTDDDNDGYADIVDPLVGVEYSTTGDCSGAVENYNHDISFAVSTTDASGNVSLIFCISGDFGNNAEDIILTDEDGGTTEFDRSDSDNPAYSDCEATPMCITTTISQADWNNWNDDGIVSFRFTPDDNVNFCTDYSCLGEINVTVPFGTNGIAISNPDTDSDGLRDAIDIDADNDGIVDFIEWQTTTNSPVTPSGNDSDNDGIDDNFEFNNTIVDTDSDGTPDYIDTNSDNDSELDILEGWDTDDDGVADTSPSGTDSDNDGLDDNFDNVVQTSGNAETTNVTNGGQNAIDDFPNADQTSTPERDWREDDDTDGDGILDGVDIDDDNDGVLDIDEGCTDPNSYSYPGSVDSQNGVTNFADVEGAPDNSFGEWHSGTGDIMVFDMGSIFPAGTQYQFTWRERTGQGGSATMILRESTTNGGFTLHSNPPVTNSTSFITSTVTSENSFRYLEIEKNGGADWQIDAIGLITQVPSVCNLDTDNDGIVDSKDLDSDNDGIADIIEAGGEDTDGNGIVDGVFNDGNNSNGWSDVFDDLDGTGGIPLANPDTDGDGLSNFQDIDADDDGIPDIIEAQVTGAIITPSGIDSDNDGIDDNFDSDLESSLLRPINTDALDNPDYIDTDSDNDGDLDILEAWDTNNNGSANTSPSGNDTDGDGLDDNFDNVAPNLTTNVSDNKTSADFPNLDIVATTTPDWREVPFDINDVDNDGIANDIDIDDDNDGILDVDEGCLEGVNETTSTIGSYTIPEDGEYTITINGGDGGGAATAGGSGATITAVFDLTAGNIIRYVIGEGSGNGTSAGGAGSTGLFIDNTLMMVAGGGAGGDNSGGGVGLGASSSTSGVNGNGTDAGSGGASGSGGTANASNAGAGGGINSAGANGNNANGGSAADLVPGNGVTLVAGGASSGGGFSAGGSGFTGGGGGSTGAYSGGGGGYSGGGAAGAGGGAGGGGSFLNTGAGSFVSGSITAGVTGGGGAVNADGEDGFVIVTGECIDTDGDGIIDSYDLDSDNDGIADIIEAGGEDSDGNGRVDNYEDGDNDGWANTFDPDNTGTPLVDPDTDGDGFNNRVDLDSDSDGISDNVEGQTTNSFLAPLDSDGDNDGWDDRYDADNGGTAIVLSNNEGTEGPDYIDLDSDGDGTPDWIEGFDDDGDGDALNDLIARANTYEAINANPGHYVSNDDNNGTTDGDGIPDWLEDSDGDGTPNFLDPDNGAFIDSDNDGIIDLYDADENGVISNTPDSNNDGEYDFRDIDNSAGGLPIDLLFFEAKSLTDKVELNWVTITEINNDYFEIQRLNGNGEFERIERVSGAGNSNEQLSYRTFDIEPKIGENYYRLRQIDFDGTESHSSIRLVRFGKEKLINGLYPNPNNGSSAKMTFSKGIKGDIGIEITDVNGNLIKSEQQFISKDLPKNEIEILEDVILIPGIYFIKVVVEENVYIEKMIVQ